MSKGGNGAKASVNGASAPQNKLHFGDNLDVLRNMPAESVDLIYLDPPFNSKAVYGVIYGTKRGGPSQAQSHAFKDMWTWGPDAQRALNETADRHLQAGALLDSFQRVFPGDNMLAYLAMMAVRLIEMQRVLKETGSLYLHCDPTASHYLRILLDAIFGPAQFRTEISWRRQSAHNDAKQGRVQYGNVRDVILFYTKGRTWTWNWLYTIYDKKYVRDFYKHMEPESGRRYRLSDLTGPGGAAKGGEHVGVDAIHKLKSVVQREKAEFGVLVCLDGPTKAMEKEVLSEGEVGPTSRRVPKLQIVTVDQIFSKHPIEIPGTLDPPEISRLHLPLRDLFHREAVRRCRRNVFGHTLRVVGFPLGVFSEVVLIKGPCELCPLSR